MDMVQTEILQQLWAESVSDEGKAYKCTRCGLWVPDFDFDPGPEICMTCREYTTRD
jgi:hypothetical protein